MGEAVPGSFQSNLLHALIKQLPIFGFINCLDPGADQFHVIFCKYAVLVQIKGAIQGCLAAHGGKNGIGALTLDDLFHDLPVDRLDVGGIGHGGIGHDGGGIGVYQDNPEPLLLEGLTGLRARIIKLAGLPDDDWAGTDDQDSLYVSSFWHYVFVAPSSICCHCRCDMRSINRSNRGATSCGPGLASGCPWKLNAGRSVLSMPCSDPSNSER